MICVHEARERKKHAREHEGGSILTRAIVLRIRQPVKEGEEGHGKRKREEEEEEEEEETQDGGRARLDGAGLVARVVNKAVTLLSRRGINGW